MKEEEEEEGEPLNTPEGEYCTLKDWFMQYHNHKITRNLQIIGAMLSLVA